MRRLCVVCLLLVGCGGSNNSPLPMVAMTDVPSAVKRAATGRRPDIRFHTAFRTPEGGYQLRGKDSRGKTIAVDLTSDGTVLQTAIN